MQMWLLGFVSGFNWYAPASGGDIGRGADVESLHAWIDQYCREHPLETLVFAAVMLIQELERRSRR